MIKRHGVLVLYNEPHSGGEGTGIAWHEADAGVLSEVASVCRALDQIGIRFRKAGVRNLEDIPEILTYGAETVVFNLVENMHGDTMDACFIPALCRSMGMACSGGDTSCLALCFDKWQNKSILRAAGIPNPNAVVVPVGGTVPLNDLPKGPVIVKPIRADASEGITTSSVVTDVTAETLAPLVAAIHQQFSQPAMVEQYINGREINVSMLQTGNHVQALPLAEIDFSEFPPDMPRIVDYSAKWLSESFGYRHTPRKIPATVTDEQERKIRELALAAWKASGCQDYARVDFRLDESGNPFVIEVNPNPDISPDAGFAAALNAANIPFAQFVATVLENAASRFRKATRAASSGKARDGDNSALTIRWSVLEDREKIIKFIADTRFFRPNEVAVAREVLDASLTHSAGGLYQSYTALKDGQPVGWICFGPTPCSRGTFDIDWIVVSGECQNQGVGSALLAHAERIIAEHGGILIVIETSSRPVYDPTRQFYVKHGYTCMAKVPGFYGPGDDKDIYSKNLAVEAPTEPPQPQPQEPAQT